MALSSRIFKRARKTALGVLQHTPRLRLVVRGNYWEARKNSYEKLANTLETDPKLVFFETFGGRNFSDSPKALYMEMLADERFSDYRFVWSFRGGKLPINFPEFPSYDAARLEITGHCTDKYFQMIAQAGTIIINTRLPEYVVPKPDQTFVQCWHGTPLKRLGYDVPEEAGGALNTASELADRFGADMKKWTYLLSPSPYTTQHLSDAFGLPEERRSEVVIEEGYPRNDVLARAAKDPASKAKARKALGIPEGKKLLLYAPTYRDDSYTSGLGYSLELDIDFDKLQAALGDEWAILFRPHYYIANQFDFTEYEGFVINGARVRDVNDLFLAADALVTDYSSVMFDFAILRRPIALFVPDAEHYEKSVRGFYFPLSEVPGAKCRTTEEVIDAVKAFDTYEEDYGEAYDRFVEKFDPLDDGEVSKRVLERVFPQ